MKRNNSPSNHLSILLFFASLICCGLIIFPPWGYDEFRSAPSKNDIKYFTEDSKIYRQLFDASVKSQISTKDLMPPTFPKISDVEKVPWTYFSHKFLFTSQLNIRIEPENDGKNFEFANPKIVYLRISWIHLLAEIAVVWLGAYAVCCILQVARTKFRMNSTESRTNQEAEIIPSTSPNPPVLP